MGIWKFVEEFNFPLCGVRQALTVQQMDETHRDRFRIMYL